jgi:hypothetical protein
MRNMTSAACLSCGDPASLRMLVRCAARRWRHRQVWLHVDQANTPAVKLYKRAGYRIASEDRPWRPPFQKRYLMVKTLQPRKRQPVAARREAAVAGDEIEFRDGQWVVQEDLAAADLADSTR